MATTNVIELRSRIVPLAVAGLALLGVVIVWWGQRLPPQIGADEGVFKAVDALYTAVRMEDPKKLDACAQRLAQFREQGKLPATAASKLDDVIATARKGEWQDAARTLYDFMRGQRR